MGLYLTILLIFLYHSKDLLVESSSDSSLCSTFSSLEEDSYWNAVDRCNSCNIQPHCGFCLSTLQCMNW